MSAEHRFVTLSGVEVMTPLNLSREQWEAYQAIGDKAYVDDLFQLADALLGEDARLLGTLDVVTWAREWSTAFRGALGLGESSGSTEPSTAPTEERSRSTSAGTRASRSKK